MRGGGVWGLGSVIFVLLLLGVGMLKSVLENEGQ
jgi:hypothetical protein